MNVHFNYNSFTISQVSNFICFPLLFQILFFFLLFVVVHFQLNNEIDERRKKTKGQRKIRCNLHKCSYIMFTIIGGIRALFGCKTYFCALIKSIVFSVLAQSNLIIFHWYLASCIPYMQENEISPWIKTKPQE